MIDIYEQDYIQLYNVGPNLDVLWYADGKVRIRHICKHSLEGEPIRIAPALQLDEPFGHVITSLEPITVTPSILCDDCGLHGFIMNGEWKSV